jgi:uncharacterized membrane protein YfcA
MELLEILGYVASIFMGLSLGLIGGGGSILTVPILVYLFKVPPVTATGYSLFIVGLSAFFGSFTYIKSRRVDFQTAVLFGIPSFIGVFLSRAYIVPSIPKDIAQIAEFHFTKDLLVMGVFALLMILASFSMIKSPKNTNSPSPARPPLPPWKSYALIIAEGLIVGGITGFVGAGGGFLIIPALVLLRGLTMRMAVGTSLTIIAAKSLFGFMGDLKNNVTIDWTLMLTISAIAVAGIFVGSALSHKIEEKTLKKSFGYFVLIMGSFILIQQLMQNH